MKSLTLVLLPVVVALAACAANPMMATNKVDNATLPEAVRAPAGTMQNMFTVGTGELTYECREKKEMAGMFEWGVVGPVATLKTPSGDVVGKYYAGPTWQSVDGSKVTGKQVGVAANGAGNIPMQLVKADTAMGMGAMQGVSHIQRLKTVGGVAPTGACAMGNKGERKAVAYQADYVFYGM